MSDTCSFETNSWLFGPSVCDNPATRVLVMGCVHEHITESLSCDRCAELVAKRMEGLHCGLCCSSTLHECTHAPSEGVPLTLLEDRLVVSS